MGWGGPKHEGQLGSRPWELLGNRYLILGLGQFPGHSYGGVKQSGIGREFSLEGMLDSFTQRKNVTVNLDYPGA